MNETEAITDAVIGVFRKTMSAGQLKMIKPDVEAAVSKVILAHHQEMERAMLGLTDRIKASPESGSTPGGKS